MIPSHFLTALLVSFRRRRLPQRNPPVFLRAPEDPRQASASHSAQAAAVRHQARSVGPRPVGPPWADRHLGGDRHGRSDPGGAGGADPDRGGRRRRAATQQAAEDRLQPQGAVRPEQRGREVNRMKETVLRTIEVHRVRAEHHSPRSIPALGL